MTEQLAWGASYVAVRPDHFRVDYQINPFMDPSVQPDPELARKQWQSLIDTIEGLGGHVSVLDQRPDAPDMVYAMNLGLAVERADGARRVVLSHMRFAERRMETGTARDFFEAQGWTTSYVGRDGVGAHFEAGDAFAFGGDLVVGFGPRTEELGLKHLAVELDARVRGLRITHRGMYHLDLAFCPLDDTRALVCPEAFDPASARVLLELVPDPIVLTEEEALTTFAANSIVVPSATGPATVVMPACPDRVRGRLEAAGFDVVVLDLSEFHKGGGSIRCLTNPVDVRLGRDLTTRPGGEVHLP